MSEQATHSDKTRSAITPSVRLWLGDFIPVLVVTHWRGRDFTGRTFYG